MPFFLLCLPLLWTACDNDESAFGETITCQWFVDDNCWKDTVVAAHSCTDDDLSGTFTGDRTQCTYADGVEINFNNPPPQFDDADQPTISR